MPANIIFLGTGGDSYVVGKQTRTAAGIVLQIGEDQFHIDPGPSSLAMAKAADINLRANTAVLVSHNHLNHANDINAVIDAMTYSGFDKKGVVVAAKSVAEGYEKVLPSLQPFYKNCVERVIIAEGGKKIGINNLEIQAIKAVHDDPYAIGFRFIAPDFNLVYSGDTSYHTSVLAEYENADILILNVPYLKKEEGQHNLCREDAVRIISRVKPKLTIMTHFGANFLKADPLYEIREIQKDTNCNVIAAKDGMSIHPAGYNAASGQKSLFKFSKSSGIRVVDMPSEQEEAKDESMQTTLMDEKTE